MTIRVGIHYYNDSTPARCEEVRETVRSPEAKDGRDITTSGAILKAYTRKMTEIGLDMLTIHHHLFTYTIILKHFHIGSFSSKRHAYHDSTKKVNNSKTKNIRIMIIIFQMLYSRILPSSFANQAYHCQEICSHLSGG